MTTRGWTTLAAAILLAGAAFGAGQEMPMGQSCCHRRSGGAGRGMAGGGDHGEDMALFHFLLDHRDEIRRSVKELPDGVETLTESDVQETAEKIREHVRSMYQRLEESRPIHARDPLFAEIFRNADKIEMSIEDTERGLRVRETSTDPYVAKLIKSHAEVVSQFLVNGHAEMRKNHPVPER
jgi:uncharacterized protein